MVKTSAAKTSAATYFPRLDVGASSDVAAREVSSLIPAPIPASAIPPVTVNYWDCRDKKGFDLTNKGVHNMSS